MLGDAGYEAYAPDWPGHGDSSKPSSSSFNYSQKAYLDSLAAFVDKCGIKKPFALVVQVGLHVNVELILGGWYVFEMVTESSCRNSH
jgi:hypothetical protein